MESVKTLYQLEQETQAAFQGFGFSPASVKTMMEIVRSIVKMHRQHEMCCLNSELILHYVKSIESRYISGEIKKHTFRYRKKVIDYLVEINETGKFTYKRNAQTLERIPFFDDALSSISANTDWSHKTRKRLCTLARNFLKWLSAKKHKSLHSVDGKIMRDYLVCRSHLLANKGLNSARLELKTLCVFWHEIGLMPSSYSNELTFYIPQHQKIKKGIPQDDIASILGAVDKASETGKRDYAILLLGAITGLRIIDIIELQLGSIDWRNGEIKITQEKTGKALALPLTTDVGEAIADYIVSERPKSNEQNVFLSSTLPFGKISRYSIRLMLQYYQQNAGLTSRTTFHGFRRSIATSMVVSGVPVTTVAQVLGHSTIDSTKQYISLDFKHLKECALSFNAIDGGVRQS